jgi:hypothetical protein
MPMGIGSETKMIFDWSRSIVRSRKRSIGYIATQPRGRAVFLPLRPDAHALNGLVLRKYLLSLP